MSTSRTTAVSLLLLSVLALCTAASSARAEEGLEPWWHLSSNARPSYLKTGTATDEVQEVRVAGDEGLYVLATGDKRGSPEGETVLSATETPSEVQRELETYIFGKGNVSVTAGQPVPGGSSYRVTFVGELEAQWISALHAKAVNANSPPVSVSEATKGRPDGVILVTADNLGDANADPSIAPITLSDTLPSGMKVVSIEAEIGQNIRGGSRLYGYRIACSRAALSCTYTGKEPPTPPDERGEYPSTLVPYQAIQMRIAVKLVHARVGAVNEARVTGGGAPPASVRRPLTISSEPMPFAVNTYEIRPEEAGGGVDTRAGSHPFQLTTTLDFNETLESRAPLTKDLRFALPPGLIGNPEPFARCQLSQFYAVACSSQSVVGVAQVTVRAPVEGEESAAGGSVTLANFATTPVYNLEPQAGEPARFGMMVLPPFEQVPVFLDTSVRTGGDYGVTVEVDNISEEAEFLGSEVTFWGVPGDSRHDGQRGFSCIEEAFQRVVPERFGPCVPLGAHDSPPLLSLPTSCTGPMLTSMEADSWAQSGVFSSFGSSEPMPALDSCNRLPFTPSIEVTPDSTDASAPTGLNVDVHVPQELTLNPTGLAESEVRDITVALPAGVAIDPAGGGGLEACPESLVGFGGFTEYASEPGARIPTFTSKLPGGVGVGEPLLQGVNFCANASKIGTVAIHTPLLPDPLKGFVYLAAQNANPFGSLVAMYVVAEDRVSGTLVKLPGVVALCKSAGETIAGMGCEAPGQIVSTFENNPQLPFEDAELHFFGGERAPLASPARCGAYTTRASYTPWSGGAPTLASSTFDVTSGPNGSPCPGAGLPFSPSLAAGSTNISAGSYTPLTTTIGREDGEQNLSRVTLHFPPGLTGSLSGVKLCPEQQANEGKCPDESLIGETTVGAGVGPDPATVIGGKVYLTEKYHGAPFGLSIVNPVKAGPFDLERDSANPNQNPACDCIVVRAKVEVNRETAALTVTTNSESEGYAIPHFIDGIPVQIKRVNVTVGANKNFTFNPTSCEKMKIEGEVESDEGASKPVSEPFQVANCKNLAFEPKASVSTSGKTSKADGASLTFKLAYPNVPQGTDADIHYVKVELPKQLPSRLTTLQKACTQTQFRANPAGCPAASAIGHAKAVVPNIPVPLEGPVYFVSNGGEAFPNLVMVLQGYGVTIDLVGDTYISKTGITSTTFHAIPDNPVTSFEISLPEGPYSALSANRDLCDPTRTVTVQKTVTVKVHGHRKKVKRKVKQTAPETLRMPTEFIAQNGAPYKRVLAVAVTGCPKVKAATQAKKQRKPHGSHGKRG